jgi:hypothetical protein
VKDLLPNTAYIVLTLAENIFQNFSTRAYERPKSSLEIRVPCSAEILGFNSTFVWGWVLQMETKTLDWCKRLSRKFKVMGVMSALVGLG